MEKIEQNNSRVVCLDLAAIHKGIKSAEMIGVKVLTPEGRILLQLVEHGPSRVKYVMLSSGASYRGFYLALDRLKDQRAVKMQPAEWDRRVRILALAPVLDNG